MPPEGFREQPCCFNCRHSCRSDEPDDSKLYCRYEAPPMPAYWNALSFEEWAKDRDVALHFVCNHYEKAANVVAREVIELPPELRRGLLSIGNESKSDDIIP